MSSVPHPPPCHHPPARLDELRAEYGGCELSLSPEARRAREAIAGHRAEAARCLVRIADLLAEYLMELHKSREFLDKPALMRNAEVRREAFLRELETLNPSETGRVG
jgi:hypothetical protein